MSKKRPAKSPKPEKDSSSLKVEADRILAIWKTAAASSMGGRKFEPAVFRKYEPKLRARILSRLKSGDRFDATARANTKAVAKDIGRVCTMLTRAKDPAVTKDTFQRVFLLMKTHPKCPQLGKGSGAWCDIPL